jgi:hypothetical protein
MKIMRLFRISNPVGSSFIPFICLVILSARERIYPSMRPWSPTRSLCSFIQLSQVAMVSSTCSSTSKRLCKIFAFSITFSFLRILMTNHSPFSNFLRALGGFRVSSSSKLESDCSSSLSLNCYISSSLGKILMNWSRSPFSSSLPHP